jgi:uncharacterized membrane protein
MIAFVAALLAAQPAAPPAPPQQPPIAVDAVREGDPDPGSAGLVPALRERGLSEAGGRILLPWLQQQDAARESFQQRVGALEAEASAALGAPHLDSARAAEALRRRDALVADASAARSSALIDLVGRLSDADRRLVLRAFGIIHPAPGEADPLTSPPPQPQQH